MEAAPDEAVALALAALLPQVTRNTTMALPVATLLGARIILQGMVELASVIRAVSTVEVHLAGLAELAVAVTGLEATVASRTSILVTELGGLKAAVTSLRDAVNSGAGHGLGEPRGLAQ